MEQKSFEAPQQFSNPEAEIVFLREQIARREAEIESQGKSPEYAAVARETVEKYADASVKHSPISSAETRKEVATIVLDLAPETHDAKMAEILSILQENGVLNALAVVDAIKTPHIEDDFPRFLVQYLRAG